jgi:hypothetical protein
MGSAALYFHNKFDVFHGFLPAPQMASKGDEQMGGVKAASHFCDLASWFYAAFP